MAALDAGVIKSYVELGLSVGVVASVAFNPVKDTGLRLLNLDQAVPINTTRIAVRKGHYLRGIAYRFIEWCAPTLTEIVVRNAMAPPRGLEIE